MREGMTWHDNSSKDFEVKVQRACDYYRSKYGARPNICFVHPSVVEAGIPEIEGLEFRPSPTVQPNFFWFGIR